VSNLFYLECLKHSSLIEEVGSFPDKRIVKGLECLSIQVAADEVFLIEPAAYVEDSWRGQRLAFKVQSRRSS
jgi:hypothetical protein